MSSPPRHRGPQAISSLILKRGSLPRPSRRDDDFVVLEDQDRPVKSAATIIVLLGNIDRLAGYEPTREAAMAAFAKSWRQDNADR
jgi:hypothetical protein